jgi:hypothetical protein
MSPKHSFVIPNIFGDSTHLRFVIPSAARNLPFACTHSGGGRAHGALLVHDRNQEALQRHEVLRLALLDGDSQILPCHFFRLG